MGCFTMYCIICGGPGENYYDNYIDEDIYMSDNTKWLNDVHAITRNYITKKGEYNSYGHVDIEGDDNMYSVCSSIWGQFDSIPSILVHTICLDILKNITKDFNCMLFFDIFKNNINEYTGTLENINYGGIENNLKQAYELNEGEEYFLENPVIEKKLNINKNIIKKQNFMIPTFLPFELQQLIFNYLDYRTLCKISTTCYCWYKLSINDIYWINMFKYEYNIDQIQKCNNIKELFKLYYLDPKIKDKIKNRKRIINCINQINLIYQKNVENITMERVKKKIRCNY